MADAKYVTQHYPRGKADLYAAFLERGLQLVKPGGLSGMVTMRGWMFINQYSSIREYLLEKFDLRLLGDLSWSAFSGISHNQTTISIIQNDKPPGKQSVSISPSGPISREESAEAYRKKAAGLLCGSERFEFRSDRFHAIKEQPIIYWWDDEFYDRYSTTPKLGEETEVRVGLQTANNTRFLRQPWEVNLTELLIYPTHQPYLDLPRTKWVPYIKGAEGKSWFEPLSDVLLWEPNALAVKLMERDGKQTSRPQNERFYFQEGAAVAAIGASFRARMHRFRSVFDVMGQSVFPRKLASATCLTNTKLAHGVLASLNPSIHFQVGDIKRLPLFPIESADKIFAQLEAAFTTHEAAREPSVEFQQPGSTCWPYAQAWAQQAVDRPAGEPLPPWEPTYEAATSQDWLSYSIGLALGRFAQPQPIRESSNLNHKPLILNDEALILSDEALILSDEALILSDESLTLSDESLTLSDEALILSDKSLTLSDEALMLNDEASTLPHGILYLSAYNPNADSLNHPASAIIHTAWHTYGSAITKGKTLHHWLRHNFFTDTHLKRYDQRPIYFPLSSTKLNFVAHISIHRWHDTTLSTLLSDYLTPDLIALEGELADLAETKNQGDIKTQATTEKRYTEVQQLHSELTSFIALVRQSTDRVPT